MRPEARVPQMSTDPRACAKADLAVLLILRHTDYDAKKLHTVTA